MQRDRNRHGDRFSTAEWCRRNDRLGRLIRHAGPAVPLPVSTLPVSMIEPAFEAPLMTTVGSTALLATARAWAWLSARDFVTPDDVKVIAKPTWRHRIQLRPEAQLEGVSSDSVLDSVLSTVAVPR